MGADYVKEFEPPERSWQRMEETESAKMWRPSKELHRAVKAGRVLVLKMLLWTPGVRVDAADGRKRTILHHACVSDHKNALRIVRMLLRAGAAVNAADGNKRTALHYACASGHEYAMVVVEMLLTAGALVNAQDKDGKTPLHLACRNMSPPVVTKLLEHGASISLVDNDGWSPLHTACHGATYSNAVYVVNSLLSDGSLKTGDSADAGKHWAGHMDIEEIRHTVNLQTRNNRTSAIQLALQQGYHAEKHHNSFIFSTSCYTGAPDEVIDSDKVLSALTRACERNVKVVVSLLIAAGAKVGVQSIEGATALHCAGKFCARNMVQVLVEQGEYVNAEDVFGNTPLHAACYAYPTSPLSPSVTMMGKVRTIDTLLSRGANLQVKNIRQQTPYECLSDMFLSMCQETEPTEDDKREIEQTFIKHVIRRKALNLPDEFHSEWRMGEEFYYEVSDWCYEEMDLMKCTEILKGFTLYSVFSLINQPYNLSRDDVATISRVIASPCLKKQFPLYYRSLVDAFHRSMLLTLAMTSFYSDCRKMKVFPYYVAKQLIVLLSNEDLKSFLISDSVYDSDSDE